MTILVIFVYFLEKDMFIMNKHLAEILKMQ